MSVRKRCGSGKGGDCSYANHKCEHTWWSELMIRGKRFPAVQIDEYAIRRGAPGHIVSKKDAEAWEAKISADWQADRDPRKAPNATDEPIRTVRSALAAYEPVKLEQLAEKGRPAARSEIRHIVEYFGDRPVIDLELEVHGFEFMSALREGWRPPDRHGKPQDPLEDGRGPVSVHRIMQRLRNFIFWGMAQKPAYLSRTPFHRHGIVIRTSDEVQRTRRLFDWEEAALLAACEAIDDLDHRWAGAVLKRRILGALEVGARGSELDRVRVGDIAWATSEITLRAGKSKHARTLGFDPKGALATAIAPRRFLKPPHDFVFGDEDGQIISYRTGWETVVLLAHGKIRVDGVGRTAEASARDFAAADLHFHDIRRECASRWWEQTKDIWRVSQWLGHGKITTTQRYLALTDTNLRAADMAEKLGFAVGDRR